ncbi:MAG: methylmalonyl Co-A mutase-associated GTPase MeaB [Burkholderiales bacterium]|nr:methylmalonyl Co-A mutase-associated GTPase MeaB [Burkholderiales bacterium]
MTHEVDLPSAWFEALVSGAKVPLGEALTIAERGGETARALLGRLHSRSGVAHIIGITGPPGSGKSTLVNELAIHFANQGRRVGVVAVDPSSPFTGGAVLGDRVRMSRASAHEGVFIRSAASRGFLGGLARTTHDFVRVLDAVGYDPIIVETVGIGQSEVDVWQVAHTPVVVEAPGLGDSIQAMKAGVLEIAAIFCINKGDLPDADAKRRYLRELSTRAEDRTPGWKIPVVTTIADRGEGIGELAEAIGAHARYLRETNRLHALEHERAIAEIRASLQTTFVDVPLARAARSGMLRRLADAVASREMNAADAASALTRHVPTDGRIGESGA